MSSWAAIGFSCLIVTFHMFVSLQLFLHYATADGIEPSRIGAYLSYYNFAAYPVNAVGLAIISVAVFLDRYSVTGEAPETTG